MRRRGREGKGRDEKRKGREGEGEEEKRRKGKGEVEEGETISRAILRHVTCKG